jgi:hypothetical protein
MFTPLTQALDEQMPFKVAPTARYLPALETPGRHWWQPTLGAAGDLLIAWGLQLKRSACPERQPQQFVHNRA